MTVSRSSPLRASRRQGIRPPPRAETAPPLPQHHTGAPPRTRNLTPTRTPPVGHRTDHVLTHRLTSVPPPLRTQSPSLPPLSPPLPPASSTSADPPSEQRLKATALAAAPPRYSPGTSPSSPDRPRASGTTSASSSTSSAAASSATRWGWPNQPTAPRSWSARRSTATASCPRDRARRPRHIDDEQEGLPAADRPRRDQEPLTPQDRQRQSLQGEPLQDRVHLSLKVSLLISQEAMV